jgi:hypothetical protein
VADPLSASETETRCRSSTDVLAPQRGSERGSEGVEVGEWWGDRRGGAGDVDVRATKGARHGGYVLESVGGA